MSKFLYILSIILIIAKIAGLVTFSWGICLLPAIIVIVAKVVITLIITYKAFAILEEELKDEE